MLNTWPTTNGQLQFFSPTPPDILIFFECTNNKLRTTAVTTAFEGLHPSAICYDTGSPEVPQSTQQGILIIVPGIIALTSDISGFELMICSKVLSKFCIEKVENPFKRHSQQFPLLMKVMTCYVEVRSIMHLHLCIKTCASLLIINDGS